MMSHPPRRRFHGLCAVASIALLLTALIGVWMVGVAPVPPLPFTPPTVVPHDTTEGVDETSLHDRNLLPSAARRQEIRMRHDDAKKSTTTATSHITLQSMLDVCRSVPRRATGREGGGAPYYHFPVDNEALVCVASGYPIHAFYRASVDRKSGAPTTTNGPVPEHMSEGLARFQPLVSEEDLEDALARPFRHASHHAAGRTNNTREHRALRFHGQSHGVMLMGTWNSVNWYHLLMDYLLGLAHWDITNLPIEDGGKSGADGRSAEHNISSIDSSSLLPLQSGAHNRERSGGGEIIVPPRTLVHIINSSWNKQWGKYDQRACLDYSSAFGSDPAGTPSVAIRTVVTTQRQPQAAPTAADDDDNALHCFCGAMYVGGHVLPRGEPSVNFESHSRSAALRHYRARMVMKYNELPYGIVPRVEHYTRLGFWANGTGSMPRLLLVNRNRRRIGNIDRIEAIATEIGFNVATVYFENMAPDVQFHLSRYADVLVAIHGMALTFVANMDGDLGYRKPSSCKTLVELMHWVNPTKFWYYQEMAPLSNVQLRRILPVDVSFGPSVVSKSKEKRNLLKNTFWWGLKGFDDQVAFHDVTAVERVLRDAMRRWKECPVGQQHG
jgi:hypothetical protein